MVSEETTGRGTGAKKYTQEYKDEVVELAVNPGRPVAEIAHGSGDQ
jgi:transposase-like protein